MMNMSDTEDNLTTEENKIMERQKQYFKKLTEIEETFVQN